MNFPKSSVAAVVLALGLATQPTIASDNLFETAKNAPVVQLNKGENDARFVKLNSQVFKSSMTQLAINVDGKTAHVAHKISASKNAQGSLVWRGTFKPQAQAKSNVLTDNSVIFVKRETGITGSIRIDGQLYKVRPAGNGLHVIVKMNDAAMPADHPPAAMSEIENKANFDFEQMMSQAITTQDTSTQAAADIRILVGYTTAAKNAVSDIQGLIELAVAETNTGYSNSGVNATMTLAHTYELNYNESNFSTDLAYFRNPNDGVMDEVHGKRDQYGADVAMIMTNVTDYCGLASGIGATSSTAFAAVYHGCATGYYSFGHEVGHLQAARHDPNNDPTNTPYAYGHGYQYGAANWRTIMAYNCSGGCTRINWWSNPNITRGGVPMGTSTRSDNARVLNITSPTMANFKGGTTPPPPPPGDVKLTNGQAETGLSGSTGNESFFYLDVPADATSLSFQISGGTGDADLYLRFGSKPTTSTYDCRPYRNGNSETCTVSNIQAGRYYVMLRAYSSYSGVSLVGEYATSVPGGFERTNLSDTRGDWQHFAVTIPAGSSSFDINMSGGSGDADLYVRRGSQSTTSSYDCRPYRNGNSESCSFNNPQAGTWYISVRAYSNYSGVNINATW
ncbi:MAG: pre-peptidase C-terminal domain-containing protein [Gammaproteobacteria bacterium]|nr:pre-peptidase C-terminal domain-containing protein [Gammaproteobacteria bacterium]